MCRTVILGCLVIPCLFSTVVRSQCRERRDQKLYLWALGCYKGEFSIKNMQVLDRRVQNELKNDELSYLDEHYLEGYQAWRGGDIMEARNHWVRFLSFCQRLGDSCDKSRLLEVQHYFQWAGQHLFPRPVESRTEPKSLPKRKYAKRVPVKIKSAPSKRLVQSVSAEKLIKKAQMAENSGQLELALELYQLAQRVSPDSLQIRSHIEHLLKVVD